MIRLERRRVGEVACEVAEGPRYHTLRLGNGEDGSSCWLRSNQSSPHSGKESATHSESHDNPSPTLDRLNVGAPPLSRPISISFPAPQHFIIRAENVDVAVEVGEEGEVIVGVEG